MGKISILNQTNYEKWEKMKNEIYSLEWNGEEPVFWTTELKRKNVLTEEEILIPFKILKLIETIKSKKSFIPIHNLEETKKSKEIREMLFYVPHNLNDFIFHISILRKIVAEHKKETIESVRNVLEKMGVYFEKDEGTIRLTNKYIKKLTGTDKDSEITKVWLNIDKIASEFRHPVGKETEEDKTKLTEDQLIRAYSDFDSDYKDPDKDYQELWMNILNSFKGSLEDLDKIISNAENSEINKFSSNF